MTNSAVSALAYNPPPRHSGSLIRRRRPEAGAELAMTEEAELIWPETALGKDARLPFGAGRADSPPVAAVILATTESDATRPNRKGQCIYRPTANR